MGGKRLPSPERVVAEATLEPVVVLPPEGVRMVGPVQASAATVPARGLAWVCLHGASSDLDISQAWHHTLS